MVDNSLKQLQQQLLATTLPKEQQEELYSKFNNTISNKIQQLKRSGVKPNEAAKSFNDFNKLLVEEELKDEHQELIKYYLESFLSQNKLSLRKDIYIDNLNFNDINRSSLSIFSNSRGSISTTVLSNTNFDSRVLNQNAINEYFHFNSDEKDYVLSADISVNEQKSTSISKTLDVTFILNDLLHKNNSYRSNKTYSFKVLKSPSMEREETTQVINTHVFGARTIGTMMD
jgi:hypothetical protein